MAQSYAACAGYLISVLDEPSWTSADPRKTKGATHAVGFHIPARPCGRGGMAEFESDDRRTGGLVPERRPCQRLENRVLSLERGVVFVGPVYLGNTGYYL